MSPHALNSLVHDLVEMAKATERLPELEVVLESKNKTIDTQADIIQRLELQEIDRKTEIDALHANIRNLEVSRDDAELRFLEVEDKLANVVAMARASQVSLGQMLGLIDPPKAQEPAPAVPVVEAQGQNAPYWSEPVDIIAGQSEVDPSALPQQASYQPVTSIHVDTQEGVNTPSESTHGPYFGKRYHDYPSYVSRFHWIEGGGTEADYDWRPEANRIA